MSIVRSRGRGSHMKFAHQLIEFCSDKMAGFMIPRYLDFRDELPKTGTHRFKKVELKKQGVTPTTWDREIEMPKKRK